MANNRLQTTLDSRAGSQTGRGARPAGDRKGCLMAQRMLQLAVPRAEDRARPRAEGLAAVAVASVEPVNRVRSAIEYSE